MGCGRQHEEALVGRGTESHGRGALSDCTCRCGCGGGVAARAPPQAMMFKSQLEVDLDVKGPLMAKVDDLRGACEGGGSSGRTAADA